MGNNANASTPFLFCTQLNITELLGIKVSNVYDLYKQIKEVPDSSIFHHTHCFLLQHQYLAFEPHNDFAYWITSVLGEEALGEQLSSIDTVQFYTINDLRKKIANIISMYLRRNPSVKKKYARPGDEFYFAKSVSVIISTGHQAHTIEEFVSLLNIITHESLYYHIFEARLRLGGKSNDFSKWLSDMFDERHLAEQIEQLDPYTYKLEDLRTELISLITKRISIHV